MNEKIQRRKTDPKFYKHHFKSIIMKRVLSVADFYNGAGGFSEGFRQMGFDVIFALDNWNAARETHKLNHPSCKHPGLDCYPETNGDILSIPINKINDIIPDVDVIVGSPPCVSFSMANKAGKADKSLGIKLIIKFLQIVAVKKHKPKSKLKYWLMENVPNSRKSLKEEYTFKMLGLNDKILKRLGIKKKEKEIALKIELNPERTLYNSVFYGVPQKRERFICGEFPIPVKTTPNPSDWISLGFVIDKIYDKQSEIITDPIYNFSIPTKEITDHFYNTIIPEFEWEEAMIKKQQARYYGKMSFPENFSKPSRTILATRSVVTRESMIFPNGIPNRFRAPTIREAACLMSFPITYLFQASNESSKYRLVGNAVCPKMIMEFAKAILLKEGFKVPKKSFIYKPNKNKLKVDLRVNNPPLKKSKDKHPLADLVEIVPDLKIRNFRIELDNHFPRSTRRKLFWNASIHHATGKDEMKYSNPPIENILQLIFTYSNNIRIKKFIKNVINYFSKKVPPAKIFQEQHIHAYRDARYFSPRKALRKVKEIVDFYFPEDEYDEIFLLNKNKDGKKYINFNRGKIPEDLIPLRIIAALLCVNYIASISNIKEEANSKTMEKYLFNFLKNTSLWSL